ncbi:MAG: penicillin-binding protein [Chloroflexota bacterium]
MAATRAILRRRRDRRETARRSVEARTQRAALGIGFLVSVLLAVLILALAFYYADLTRDLPSVEQLPTLLDPPDGLLLQPTRIYDRSGQHLLETFALGESLRRYIPLDPGNPQHLPEALVQATLALADPTFWKHPGYTLAGLGQPDLHPTIAQRLASDLLLWDESPSLRRALRERLLAAQITARYGRTQVLEWYLNSADYGHYAYGADAAAQLYFGKPAAELTPAEAAVLAAVSQAPSLNPLDAPQAVLQRGRETIHIMQALGFISKEAAGLALAETPAFPAGETESQQTFAPAFLNLVLQQLDKTFDRARIQRGGLTIITTLDYELQQQASCAMQVYLQRLQGSEASAGSAPQAECEAARLLPSLPSDLLVHDPSASAMILDPRNGQALAAVGESFQGQESASWRPRNSGSLLTPFVYLTGFTRGLSPASLVWDVPGAASIRNLDDEYHGPLRLRLALANDYLVPAAQVLEQMGLENVLQTADSFGLDLARIGPTLEPVSVISGNSYPLALLDVSSAYAVLATGGVRYGQPSGDDLAATTLLRVESADHAIWLDGSNPLAQPVVAPQLAYLLNHVLSDEPARWPSLGHPNAFEIGRPAGAKTGATLDGLDAWAVGYTPYRVVTVWTGTRAATGERLSPRLPAGLWYALMQTASRGLPPDGWDPPAGITSLDVCDPSGLLPTRDCPTTVREVFTDGNQPTQPDTLYRVYEINRETGFLATVFTPPQLVEQRVYMTIPPEARAWAEANGFTTPPDTYDAIQPVAANPQVYISAPAMFADVRGVVEITGTAAGENLDYFRVLVGQGLNPQAWMQIGSDSRSLALDGQLARWDTAGLDGLYAVQLQVVRADQLVDTAVTQVTVDNTAPQVSILYPQDGLELDYASNRQVAFQAQAGDNLSLAAVEFYVDGELAGALEEAPFDLSWNARRGEHTLRVVARDRAGNEGEEEVRFNVK